MHREPVARRPAGQPGHAAELDWRGGRCVDDLRRDPAAPQARARRLSHRASGWRPRCGPPPSHEATKETPMRKQALILGALLLLPLAATAADQHCEHSQPRNLQLDMAGVKTVVFEIGANDLDVRAVAAPGNTVEGRACASRESDLPRLVLTQHKSGDRLIVTAEREHTSELQSLMRISYAVFCLKKKKNTK